MDVFNIYFGGKKRERELALGFVEIQWLLGVLPEVGGGSIDQMGCPGGGKVIRHETAQDLSSINSEMSIRPHLKGEVRKQDVI